eukprot:713068-Pelagomonas_calceolata.AAC.1
MGGGCKGVHFGSPKLRQTKVVKSGLISTFLLKVGNEQVLHALAPRPVVIQVEGLDVDALVRCHAALFAAPAMPAVGTSISSADPPRTMTS